ncbi:hypothetical protein [Roseivirga sp.]|uniref:hypothetical protein n=1 Tax=Roseivirga sp. TaxID=1964215 RepID=UPI003B5166B4
MKLLLFLIVSSFLYDQETKIKEVTDISTVQLISSIQSCSNYSTKAFIFSSHRKTNPYRSAQNDSGEIIQSYCFAISNIDGYPKTSVFEVGALYKPEITEVRPFNENIEVDVSYFAKYQKGKKTLKVINHQIAQK